MLKLPDKKDLSIQKVLVYIEWILILLIVFFGFKIRLQFFDDISKDIYAYEKAISDLNNGINPYLWTVESYNQDDPTNHGFAYLPTMLYVNSFLNFVANVTDIHFKYLWKIPVLLADIAIVVFLLKKLKNQKPFVKATAIAMWLLNPYAYFRGGYTYFDPIPILFMLLSIERLEDSAFFSGIYYAISISLKTFPYILFPVFIIKLWPKESWANKPAHTKNSDLKTKINLQKYKNLLAFLGAGTLFAILISIPFMRSVEDFTTYLSGTLFVHSNRYVQGRPFLFYISYFYKIELFQIIPFKVYTLLASFSGGIISLILYLKGIVKNKYALFLIPFLAFYFFTPVLNRTYLIWFIPIFVISINDIFKSKRYLFYIVNLVFYYFYTWYLLQWEDGFHIWHP
jgi:hypothetical protein